MTFGEIVVEISKLAEASFELLVIADNGPNIAFIGIGFVMLIIWMRQMVVYRREAKRNGTPE
ncbi:MAG: hypothetical protein ACFB10_18265 [Salibacteraceae bacterium]|mgnify:CR=1 FL=1